MTTKKNHDVIQSLSKLLSGTYILLVKTQNYHWNVTGPQFSELHAMFETQYNELFAAVDEIAERLRALGEKAPGSFASFSELSSIKEDSSHPAAETMIKNLARDHETLAADADAVIKASDEIGDEGSADLATNRIRAHQKTQWMLDAHLR